MFPGNVNPSLTGLMIEAGVPLGYALYVAALKQTLFLLSKLVVDVLGACGLYIVFGPLILGGLGYRPDLMGVINPIFWRSFERNEFSRSM